jgi:hypothetical protein
LLAKQDVDARHKAGHDVEMFVFKTKAPPFGGAFHFE